MNKCYIFGAAEGLPKNLQKQNGDFIIAADKGFETLKNLNIEPDIIIGDFDSLGFTPEEENVVALPIKKDDTDTLFARLYLEAFEYLKFKAHIYNRMQVTENGVAYIYIDKAMQEQFSLSLEQASACIGNTLNLSHTKFGIGCGGIGHRLYGDRIFATYCHTTEAHFV